MVDNVICKGDVLTQANIKSLVIYNPSLGLFINKKTGRRIGFKHNSRSRKDYEVGKTDKFYTKLQLGSRRYYAHRLAWLYVYGQEPDEGMQIDHIDGDGTNNKINNLRLVTQSENNHNNNHSRGASKKRGVVYSLSQNKWIAMITNNKRTYSRNFDSEIEAIKCRLEMEENIREFGSVMIPKKKNQYG